MYDTPVSSDLLAIQREFTDYLRDPDNKPAPSGQEARRLAIYRDAVFANIEGLVGDNFPIIKSMTDPKRWRAMIRDFLIKHQCQIPYFPRLTLEFIAYLENERRDDDDPPFLNAHV